LPLAIDLRDSHYHSGFLFRSQDRPRPAGAPAVCPLGPAGGGKSLSGGLALLLDPLSAIHLLRCARSGVHLRENRLSPACRHGRCRISGFMAAQPCAAWVARAENRGAVVGWYCNIDG